MKYGDHFFDEKLVTFQDPTPNKFDRIADFEFNFQSVGISIANIGAGTIVYSFNGCRIDGRLDCVQRSITMDNKSVSRIWLKLEQPDPSDPSESLVRVSAWPKVIA